MPVKSFFSNPKKACLWIAAVNLLVGAYLLLTCVIISKDGVNFIEFAQRMQTQFVQSLKDYDQHPGYSLLILGFHQIGWFGTGKPAGWIYSAQIVSLLCRVLFLLLLYLYAKKFTLSWIAFCSVLLFSLLPYGAHYGSDALSDWPYLAFLAVGVWILLNIQETRFYLTAGITGIIAGLSYLIRPEGIQLLLYAVIWIFTITRNHKNFQKQKIIPGLLLLGIGFAIFAGPYIFLKGSLFPKKDMDLTYSSPPSEFQTATFFAIPGAAPANYGKAPLVLFNRIAENLVYYFVPFYFWGLWLWFKKNKNTPMAVWAGAVILLNVCILVWLYNRYGYMSKRHVLTLLVLTCFFTVEGLWAASEVLSAYFTPVTARLFSRFSSRTFCMTVLLCTGVCIVLPKLITPIHADKRHYLQAATELQQKTASSDVIAVPDRRIGFYAERNYIVYSSPEQIPTHDVLVEVLPGKTFSIRYKTTGMNQPKR